jgi:hypothetical protein
MAKRSLKDLQDAAKELGGECLSKKYRGMLAKYRWRCKKCGNEWEATATGLYYSRAFCKRCSLRDSWVSRKTSIDDVRAFIEGKGGRLLSTHYENTKAKLEVACAKGHKWRTSFDRLKQDRWCGVCSRKRQAEKQSYTISEMQELAKQFGGECLSTSYAGIFEPLTFRCADGHVFQRQPALLTKTNPLARVWCPHCRSSNYSENACRAVIEAAFGRDFPSIFPGDWLRNARGRKMQLDGYCSDLKLAFEYHGQQHFEVVFPFDSRAALTRRQADDRLKASLCSQHGITLVEIPPFKSIYLSTNDIIAHVQRAFAHANVALPNVHIDEMKARLSYYSRGKINELKEVAEERGGKLLSDTYYTMHDSLEWQCGEGHESWTATAASIVYGGTWCPRCAGTVRGTIEELRELARARGGECLSEEYVNTQTHVIWRCGDGHIWNALPLNVKRGTWCPTCNGSSTARSQPMLERFKATVSEKGGRVLDDARTSKSKVQVECAEGHNWTTTPESIVYSGSWCRTCSNDAVRRKFDEKLRAMVESKGGTVEGRYATYSSRMTFTCDAGHSWTSAAATVLGGSWCRQCRSEEIASTFAERFSKHVARRGGRVSGRYVNAKTRIEVVCANGHVWRALPDSVLTLNAWCLDCHRDSLKAR